MNDEDMDDEVLSRTLCVEYTHFPDVDETWLEDKARAIRKALVDRLGRKLEWGQVVTLPRRNGIGLALLFARGHKIDETLPMTVSEIVCENTDIVLPKGGGRGPAKRKGGLPQAGLGPRFPAEFYESRGRIGGHHR